VPRTVEVDGTPSRALAIINGHLNLRVSAGQHRVVLTGPLQGSELTLSLGTAPHRVAVSNDGWDVDGVDEDGQASTSIRFFRAAAGVPPEEKAPPGEPAPEPSTTPPWLQVTRQFDAGVKWTLRTHVRRVSAKGQPIVVKLPLLDGESVTEGSAKQMGREATITLARDATEASFVSSLAQTESVTLKAAVGQPWSEVWSLNCSEVWRCAYEGIAPIAHMKNDTWQPRFLPWPGEAVKFALVKPAAAEGRSLTILGARLKLQARDRVTEARLGIKVHASSGGAYVLKIPTGVRIDSLVVGGRAQPVEGNGGELKVALIPGHQDVTVAWQEPAGIATFYRAPEIVLGDQIVNAIVDINIPNERWTVFARGPGLGPDFQLWGYLLLLIAVALGISRIPDNPLKPWQWVLLAAGLTQAPVPLAIVVGAWFFLIAHRKRWKLERRTHNVVQVLVVVWTIAFAVGIVGTIYTGLAEHPQMMLVPRTRAQALMSWYVDRTAGAMPRPWVLSTSMWAWRLLMAAWSAWAAVLVYRWAPKALASFKTGGIWRSAPARAATVAGPEAPTPPVAQAPEPVDEP
jgi:hypothetical protein